MNRAQLFVSSLSNSSVNDDYISISSGFDNVYILFAKSRCFWFQNDLISCFIVVTKDPILIVPHKKRKKDSKFATSGYDFSAIDAPLFLYLYFAYLALSDFSWREE